MERYPSLRSNQKNLPPLRLRKAARTMFHDKSSQEAVWTSCNPCNQETVGAGYSPCYLGEPAHGSQINIPRLRLLLNDQDTVTDSHQRRNRFSPYSTNNHGKRLWYFLLQLLDGTENMDDTRKIIRWENRDEGMFRIHSLPDLAILWGREKNNSSMDHNKLRRALGNYIDNGKLQKINKHVYKFTNDFLEKNMEVFWKLTSQFTQTIETFETLQENKPNMQHPYFNRQQTQQHLSWCSRNDQTQLPLPKSFPEEFINMDTNFFVAKKKFEENDIVEDCQVGSNSDIWSDSDHSDILNDICTKVSTWKEGKLVNNSTVENQEAEFIHDLSFYFPEDHPSDLDSRQSVLTTPTAAISIPSNPSTDCHQFQINQHEIDPIPDNGWLDIDITFPIELSEKLANDTNTDCPEAAQIDMLTPLNMEIEPFDFSQAIYNLGINYPPLPSPPTLSSSSSSSSASSSSVSPFSSPSLHFFSRSFSSSNCSPCPPSFCHQMFPSETVYHDNPNETTINQNCSGGSEDEGGDGTNVDDESINIFTPSQFDTLVNQLHQDFSFLNNE